MSDIVIINPRFNVSFWGMEKCMGLLGKRANLPVACLPCTLIPVTQTRSAREPINRPDTYQRLPNTAPNSLAISSRSIHLGQKRQGLTIGEKISAKTRHPTNT